jgi:ABC-type glutathione transport system ATPase component
MPRQDDDASEGRTVLFVSHNLSALANLCKKTFWLDQGKIVDYGQTSQIIQAYLAKRMQTNEVDLTQHPGRRGQYVMLQRLRFLNDTDVSSAFQTNKPFRMEVECLVDPSVARQVTLGITVRDMLGTVALATHYRQYYPELRTTGKPIVFEATIDPLPLTPGS